MRSGTSYFEKEGLFSPALFRKNVERFWPLWASYLALLIFLLPVALFNDAKNSRGYSGEDVLWLIESQIEGPTVFVLAVTGLGFAMALFSYLMDRRQVQMLHALPIRREGLFLTNWVSGLAFTLGPELVAAALAFLVLTVTGTASGETGWALLVWLAMQVCVGVFFFSLAVFCAMFTGNLLALPVFYGIINFLVMGVFFLVDSLLGEILVGYRSGLSGSEPVRWVTPCCQLVELLNRQEYLAVACYCLIIGALLAVLALAVYRQRQLERAGDLVTVGWVRPVFQYGFALCVGLSLGQVLYYNFFTFLPTVWLLPVVVICGAVGAFAGRMLLKKSLRVFAEGWKGVAVFSVVLALVLGGTWVDLLGYQRKLPALEDIQSVELNGPYTAPWDSGEGLDLDTEDPELIRQVLELHAALLEDLERLRGEYNGIAREGEYAQSANIHILYTLQDGSTLYRRYRGVPFLSEELDDPDSPTARLVALLNHPEVIRQSYWGYLGRAVSQEEKPVELTVVSGQLEQLSVVAQNESAEQKATVDMQTKPLTLEEVQRLWQAVQEDLEAGRIGRRYLFDNEERRSNCYQSDLTLDFVYYYYHETEEGERRELNNVSLCITIQKTATSTMAALEELGYTSYLVEWPTR